MLMGTGSKIFANSLLKLVVNDVTPTLTLSEMGHKYFHVFLPIKTTR